MPHNLRETVEGQEDAQRRDGPPEGGEDAHPVAVEAGRGPDHGAVLVWCCTVWTLTGLLTALLLRHCSLPSLPTAHWRCPPRVACAFPCYLPSVAFTHNNNYYYFTRISIRIHGPACIGVIKSI